MSSKLIIYGDGGSRGNPGEAAYGFVIYDDKMKILYQEGKKIGIDTNNVAEYNAVVNALIHVKRCYPKVTSIEFRLDSLLVASQMSGKFKVKHPSMKVLFVKAKELERVLNAQIVYKQIPRAKNFQADLMVNKALDSLI